MSYQVLARKWRPQTFQEVVGQEHVTATLSNALDLGRVAHAYLFTGPRGCGKTTMARLMAKALNCDSGPTSTPCGECPSCKAIAEGTLLDVLEIDAASNTGVDNIRELRENAQYQPSAGKKRIFIIDEVHMLSKGAFNALLKILEEPPAHVHFIFATTEPVRIPRTILSRCQRFDFRLFRIEELLDRYKTIVDEESFSITLDALELLASLAEGSMRDALSLLDQAISATEGELDQEGVLRLYGLVGHEPYLELNEAILEKDSRKALDLVDGLVSGGHDLVEFARGLVANFRDLLLLRLDPALSERVEKPESIRKALADQATRFHPQDLLHLTQRSAEHYSALERAPQPRWLLDAQMVEYTTLESQVLLSEILGRLDALGSVEGGAAPATGGGNARKAAPTSRPAGKSTPASTAAAVETPSPASRRANAAQVGSAQYAEPESAPVIDKGNPDQDPAFRSCYSRWMSRVREENMAIGTCLLEAAPRWEDGKLTLVFRPEHDFHREQVGLQENIRWILPLARECFKVELQLEICSANPLADEEDLRRSVQEEVAPSGQQDLQRHKQENPQLGRLLDGLGGRVTEDS